MDALLKALLPVSRAIDATNRWIGRHLAWLILAAVVISATNAVVRKLFDMSSNSWLELQWVLFSAVFLGCASWTLLDNEHIRIDIVNNALPRWLRDTIEVVGHALFLLPLTIVMMVTALPFFLRSFRIDEQSGNAGGLPQWPAKSLVFLGFMLLFFQAISELLKRLAVIRGLIPDPHARGVSSAEAEAERLLAGLKPEAEERGNMIAFLIDYMAPIMFASLVVFLLLGYPAAFSLGAVGLLYAVLGIELGLFQPDFLQALPERVYGVMNNDTLLAIPFFTFMGLVLERSGMAEDLLDTIGQLFGTVRGGLAYAVVFVGALLAATTGVVAASVISMGLISLPIMLRYGYDRRVAAGVIAASGTLAQIIPPSLVLIVMADQLGRSVGDMYEGAFIPGITLAGLYAVYVFIVTVLFPKATPGLPLEAVGFREENGKRGLLSLLILAIVSGGFGWYMMRGSESHGADYVVLTMFFGIAFAFAVAVVNWLTNRLLGFRFLSHIAQQTTFVMVPPLALIFLVLGTIFIGVATPTEGGAMGAAGAIILALAKRRLTWDLLRQATESTAKLSAFVIFILIGARVFSLTFYGVNGHVWVENMLTSLPGGQIGFLIFVNVFVFFLAFFLDFFELAFIVIPLLGPAAEHLGIDLIWFGVILGVNMQTSFMHPPFGFALFYLRSVAPYETYTDRVTGKRMAPVTTGQIYWGAVPFVIIQCIMVGLVIAFPAMVMHYKGVGTGVDPTKVNIEIQQPDDLPPLDFSQPPK